MIVARIDPRDQQWQEGDPVFRVCFWTQLDGGAFQSDEFELADADVGEVLAWAEQERAGRTFTLYLRRDDPSGRGLVLLAGTDPTINRTSR